MSLNDYIKSIMDTMSNCEFKADEPCPVFQCKSAVFIKDDPRYWQLYEKAGFNIYDAYLKKQRSMQKSS